MDTIGNMFAVLVNAQRAGRQRVVIRHSLFKEQLAKLLQTKGFVAKVRVQSDIKPKLVITMLTDDLGQPKITSAQRLSKPGKRSYIKNGQIPYTGNRPGIYIVSTSQGLMDQKEARAKGLGGELIGVIWQ